MCQTPNVPITILLPLIIHTTHAVAPEIIPWLPSSSSSDPLNRLPASGSTGPDSSHAGERIRLDKTMRQSNLQYCRMTRVCGMAYVV
ncbi:hypothetical protein DFP73DRAFT_275179 [Morchella snyderi]|nr:hypothetical protein DFP73DRAFT_275179 [Morchella snyderi]